MLFSWLYVVCVPSLDEIGPGVIEFWAFEMKTSVGSVSKNFVVIELD